MRACWSAGHLQIVTNSLPVANLFASGASTDLVLVGGYVYPRTGVSLGPYANQMLANLSVRRTVLSVAGINDRGFFNSNLLLVETEQAMLHACGRSDRRGRQREVWPSKPGASLRLGTSRLPGRRSRDRSGLAEESQSGRASELVIAEPPDAQPLKNP